MDDDDLPMIDLTPPDSDVTTSMTYDGFLVEQSTQPTSGHDQPSEDHQPSSQDALAQDEFSLDDVALNLLMLADELSDQNQEPATEAPGMASSPPSPGHRDGSPTSDSEDEANSTQEPETEEPRTRAEYGEGDPDIDSDVEDARKFNEPAAKEYKPAWLRLRFKSQWRKRWIGELLQKIKALEKERTELKVAIEWLRNGKPRHTQVVRNFVLSNVKESETQLTNGAVLAISVRQRELGHHLSGCVYGGEFFTSPHQTTSRSVSEKTYGKRTKGRSTARGTRCIATGYTTSRKDISIVQYTCKGSVSNLKTLLRLSRPGGACHISSGSSLSSCGSAQESLSKAMLSAPPTRWKTFSQHHVLP